MMGLQFPLVEPGADLPEMIKKASGQVGGIQAGDVVVIASSALATAQGRLRDLSGIQPSPRAKRLARKTGMNSKFVELVLRESDKVVGGSKGILLTIKDGILCANAGADRSNAPKGHAVLMPEKPDAAAEEIRRKLSGDSGKIGVVIADSHIKPLRLGTVAQAIGIAGFEPVEDCRGQQDLFGNRLKITFRAVADQLATAAQLLMGEAAERTPVVIIRGAKVEFTDKPEHDARIPPSKCAYMKSWRLRF
jgi:coenzyme F420-0:L-glutamate ligase